MLRQTVSSASRALRSTARLGTQRQAIGFAQSQHTPLALASRTLVPRARWYSDAVKEEAAKEEAKTEEAKTEEAKTEEAKKEGESEPESPEAAFKKQLEEKDAEIRKLKDHYLRSVADFRNLQERTQREIQKSRDFAIQKFAKDLVESVDNFDRALGVVPAEKLKPENKAENEDLVNFFDGLKMTENILMSTLKKHGLERFEPTGEVFNPNEHEATFMTPMPDKDHNTVFHVQQKGFKLNGRVLRPAQVGVVKNK